MTRWQSPPPDEALRAAIDSVFAAPAYRWVEQPDPLRLLRDWFGRLRRVARSASRGESAVVSHTDRHAGARAGHDSRPRGLGRLAHAPRRHLQRADVRIPPGCRAPARFPDALGPRRIAPRGRGAHADALRLGFLALTLELDAGGSVTYAPGKTPAEYAREARLAPGDRGRLRELVRALYRHVYGAAPCRSGRVRPLACGRPGGMACARGMSSGLARCRRARTARGRRADRPAAEPRAERRSAAFDLSLPLRPARTASPPRSSGSA